MEKNFRKQFHDHVQKAGLQAPAFLKNQNQQDFNYYFDIFKNVGKQSNEIKHWRYNFLNEE